MAITNNIAFYKGEAVTLALVMSPVVEIGGWTVVLTVRRQPTDVAAVLSVAGTVTDGPNGAFQVVLTHAQTGTTLTTGTYFYDIQRTNAGFETVLSLGKITVLQEVLYP